MLLRENVLKVAIFHIKNAIETFMKGISWNLVHTFFRGFCSTCFTVFENLEIWVFFEKMKKNVKNLKISKIFNISKIRDRRVVAQSFLSMHFLLPLSLKISVWQPFPQTLIFLPKMAEHDVTLTSLTADLS